MKLKVGNSVDLLFSIKDSSGHIITNLNTATAIRFMVKVNETDTNLEAKISKTLSSGIVIDTPSIGNIKVSLTTFDTTIPAGIYFMALQIEWGTSIQELVIKETINNVDEINTINMIQDIIR